MEDSISAIGRRLKEIRADRDPVSYTHLCGDFRLFSLRRGIYRCRHVHIIIDGKSDYRGGGDFPVSYTHLDVYKRQDTVYR